MLQFFRKYQKIFFILVTVAIVVSFLFFGTYSTLMQQKAPEDKEIGRGIAGRPIYYRELTTLCRVLNHSSLNQLELEKGESLALLNDGVLEKEFLATGLGVMLAKSYFDTLKSEWDLQAKKVKSYRPYVHPQASNISAEATWSRFSPSFFENYKRLKQRSDQATLETFALLSRGFLEQTQFSPEILRRLLVMQQNQLGVPGDPVLLATDLSLFGFKTAEDWFGSRFIMIIAQFILNVAQVAEERGYRVSREEVRGELWRNIAQGYQQRFREEQLGEAQTRAYYQAALRSIGVEEEGLLHVWKKVMLYRRLMNDAGGSVFLDPLAFSQFEQFSKENMEISLYQLPKALCFTDFSSLFQFQVYLEAIAKDPTKLDTHLQLPDALLSVESIEQKHPELIERLYALEWAEIKRADLEREMGVKMVWDWECEESSWKLLQKQFPELAQIQAITSQERWHALLMLDPQKRLKIDLFAREKIIDASFDKIQLALARAPVKTQEVSIRTKGGHFPFGSAEKQREFVELLEASAVKGEESNEANAQLRCYTTDAKTYYRIEVVRPCTEKRVISFEQAKKDGTLVDLLDQRLEEAYLVLRKKDPKVLPQSQGRPKSFREVKEFMELFVFSELLQSIKKEYIAYFGTLPQEPEQLLPAFYGIARFLPHCLKAEQQIRLDCRAEERWCRAQGGGVPSLIAQWQLERIDQVVERGSIFPFIKHEMFALHPQDWSKIQIAEEQIGFYHVKSHQLVNAPPIQSLEVGHEILTLDAKRAIVQQILAHIQEKQAIDPTYVAEREVVE